MKISSFFQYSGTNWYSRGAKNMKISSLIMIFHEFFHYIGLPPPKYRPKASFMKIDYFSRKTHFLKFGFLKPLQDRALELKLSPPGFFNIPDRSKTTPGPQEAPNTSKNRFFENLKKSPKNVFFAL